MHAGNSVATVTWADYSPVHVFINEVSIVRQEIIP